MADFGRINTSSTDGLANHTGGKLSGGEVFQTAAEGSNSGACTVDHNNFSTHGDSPWECGWLNKGADDIRVLTIILNGAWVRGPYFGPGKCAASPASCQQ
jgi:hypothetical protein